MAAFPPLKSIRNRRREYRDGVVCYAMDRTIGRDTYGYALHLSPAEIAMGRDYVAAKVRKARRDFQKSIEEARRRRK